MTRLGCLVALVALGIAGFPAPADAATPVFTMATSVETGAFGLHEAQLLEPAPGVDASGWFVVDDEGVDFAPKDVVVHAHGRALNKKTMHIDLVPAVVPESGLTGDVMGAVDFATNHAIFAASFWMVVSVDGMFGDCAIGPVSWAMDSGRSGGAAYDPSTGAATVVDDVFTIPAAVAGTSGCGNYADDINHSLGLPSAPGAARASITFTATPALGEAATSSSTSSTSSTTSTAAPTTTTPTTTAPTTVGRVETPPTDATTTPTASPEIMTSSTYEPVDAPGVASAPSSTRAADSRATARSAPKPARLSAEEDAAIADPTTTTLPDGYFPAGAFTSPDDGGDPGVPEDATPSAARIGGGGRRPAVEPIAETSSSSAQTRVLVIVMLVGMLSIAFALMRSEVSSSAWARRRRYARSRRAF